MSKYSPGVFDNIRFTQTEVEIKMIAKKRNQMVVFPYDDELLLDIDKPHSKDLRDLLNKNVAIMQDHIDVRSTFITRSRSGRAHVYMWLDRELDPFARIAIQACFGSDHKRELLSVLRGIAQSKYTTALFENYNEFRRVIRWRLSRVKKVPGYQGNRDKQVEAAA